MRGRIRMTCESIDQLISWRQISSRSPSQSTSLLPLAPFQDLPSTHRTTHAHQTPSTNDTRENHAPPQRMVQNFKVKK
jgi:hypothetical protein